MQMLTHTYRALSAEALKQQYWLVWRGPFVAGLIAGLFFLAFQIEETGIANHPPDQTLWQTLFIYAFNVYGAVAFPLAASFWAACLTGMEHQHHGWQHLYSTAIGRGAVFASKFAYLALYALGSVLCFEGLLLLAGAVLHFTRPELGFFASQWPTLQLLRFPLIYWAGTLGMLVILYWLALRLRNLNLMLGIGMLLLISMGGIGATSYPLAHPGLYGILTAKQFLMGKADPAQTSYWALGLSLSLTLLLAPLAYRDTQRRPLF